MIVKKIEKTRKILSHQRINCLIKTGLVKEKKVYMAEGRKIYEQWAMNDWLHEAGSGILKINNKS